MKVRVLLKNGSFFDADLDESNLWFRNPDNPDVYELAWSPSEGVRISVEIDQIEKITNPFAALPPLN